MYDDVTLCVMMSHYKPALAETDAEVEAEREVVVLAWVAVEGYVCEVRLARVGKGGPLREAGAHRIARIELFDQTKLMWRSTCICGGGYMLELFDQSKLSNALATH